MAIKISLSEEHCTFLGDVKDCFNGLDLDIKANYSRKSGIDLPMQIMIFVGSSILGGIIYDSLKISIKKLLKKFKEANLTIIDEKGSWYQFNKNQKIKLIHPLNESKEFGEKTIDELFYSLREEKKKWKKYKLGNVLEIKYGKDHKLLEEGRIPCFGSGGVMRFVDKALYEDESILIPRKGSLNNIIYQKNPFWTVDTMFWSKINKNLVVPKFLFYQLTLIDYTNLNVGSAVPSLTVPIINEIEIKLPPLQEQREVTDILSSLDDKIDLLHRQNKTLESLAETLFRQYFIEEAKDDWVVKPLGSLITVKRGGSPRPIQEFLSESGYSWLKISDITNLNSPYIFKIKEHIKKEGLKKTTLLNKNSLVLSNSATPGIAKILQVDSCIHDGWLHFPESYFTNEFLYLLFSRIRPELVSQGNGSIFINLKTDIIKEYEIPIPNKETLREFQDEVDPIFKKLLFNSKQIQTLEKLRDTLLPKLMSGEVKVKYSDT